MVKGIRPTSRWTTLRPHAEQAKYFQSNIRFNVVPAGRRSGKCLPAGTQVVMADGTTKAIECIQAGEHILSMGNDWHLHEDIVSHVHKNGKRGCLRMGTAAGQVEATPNHPFLVQTHWVELADIKIGDFVALQNTPDQSITGYTLSEAIFNDVHWLPVTFIELAGEKETYDLTVTGNHNFIADGFITHNTELAKRRVILRCIQRILDKTPRFHTGRFFCAAPTRDQAKRIYWEDLKALVPKQYLSGQPRETDLIIQMKNRVELHVIGLDKPQRFEGSPWDGGILDEYGNMKSEAWMQNIFPALADRQGWCDLIGVPEGRNHYYDRWLEAISCTDGSMEGHHWTSEEILPASEIAMAKRMLDEQSYEQEFRAQFVSFSGQAYYPFNEKDHVSRLQYDPKADLVFCFDFNVSPGVAAVVQEQIIPGAFELLPDPHRYGRKSDAWSRALKEGGLINQPVFGTGVIGEVYIKNNSNTPAVCRKLIQDWGEHQGNILIYGDASGGNRGTAKIAGSDWDLIEDVMFGHYGNNRVFFEVPRSNPPERSRVNAVNARLKSIDGTVRMAIDPVCKMMIKDLEGVRLLEGGSGEIDKKNDKMLSHMCFAGDTLVNGLRIEDMPEAGEVRTMFGMSSYVGNVIRGHSKLVKLTFDDGSTLRCTPDHLIMTNDGWKMAVDSMDTFGYFTRINRGFICDEIKSHSTGNFTNGMANTSLLGEKRACTLPYGNTIMALSQNGIAERQRVERLVLMTLKDNVHIAETSLKSTNTYIKNAVVEYVVRKIIKVKQLPGSYPVYCPTVEAGHFLLDSGLVVSNSDSLGYYCIKEFPVREELIGNLPVGNRF